MRGFLLATLLVSTAAAAGGNTSPRTRCSTCSILPPGTVGVDLTLASLNIDKIYFSSNNCSGTTGQQLCTDAAGLHYYVNSTQHWASLQAAGGLNTQFGFTSTAGTGSKGFALSTNGAFIDFGAGAADDASSDGTTVTFRGPTASTESVRLIDSGNGATTLGLYSGHALSLTNGTLGMRGAVADGVGVSVFDLGNVNAITAGVDRALVRLWRDNFSTVAARIWSDGSYQNTATIGTAASGTGITATYSGFTRQFVHKVTVINTALAAAANTDVTLATTPLNTRITRVTADVTQVFTGGALSAMTVTCGSTAGGNQYLLSGSVFTAQTALGDVVAEMGAGVVSSTLADFGTVSAGVPGAITVSCRFTCTGALCNAATQGSVTFYVEGTAY